MRFIRRRGRSALHPLVAHARRELQAAQRASKNQGSDLLTGSVGTFDADAQVALRHVHQGHLLIAAAARAGVPTPEISRQLDTPGYDDAFVWRVSFATADNEPFDVWLPKFLGRGGR